jgi:hypothetical protein
MSTTATEKKKRKDVTQISFKFGLAKTPDFIREDNKEERGTIHYLIPKEKVENKKVSRDTFFFKQVFFNVDFRMRHHGITEVARQAGINLRTLEPGNVAVFFNSARTQFMLAFSGQTMLHHNNGSQKIEMRAIDDIIRNVLRTGKLSYEDGLADFLKKRGHGADEKNTKLN